MTTLTRSVLLRSQPITAGDSTSDREVRDATAPRDMKTCTRCGIARPLSVYAMDRGRRNSKCTPCRNEIKKQAYARNIEESRAYARRRYIADPESKKNSVRRWYAANPERMAIAKKARDIVYESVKRGVLIRPTRCSQCERNDTAIEAAHTDYSKPLEVIWLCRPCHRRWDQADPKTKGGHSNEGRGNSRQATVTVRGRPCGIIAARALLITNKAGQRC